MRARFVSYYSAWSRENGAGRGIGLYIAAVSFLAACALTFLTRHTELSRGMFFHEQWRTPILLLVLVAVLAPVPASLCVKSRLWRLGAFTPLLWPVLSTELRLCISFLAGAGVISWAASHSRRPIAAGLFRLGGNLAEIAFLLFFAYLAGQLYDHAAARLAGFPPLAAGIAALFRWCGISAHTGAGGMLYLSQGNVTQPILMSGDKFGGAFPLLFLVIVGVMSAWRGVAPKRLLAGVTLIAGYAFLRTVILLSSLVIAEMTLDWWDEGAIAASYLPLALLLPVVLGVPRAFPGVSEVALPGTPWTRKAAQFVLCLTGAFFLASAWLWVDPGTPKKGAVLLDERYSRWEWSEKPLDTRLFGVQTVYSYYNLVETLKRYYPTRRNFEDITDETLKDVSVLILKTPTTPYPAEAREAIHRFVARGGGLWLVGDHTDVFGMDSYLNLILERYGASFRKDAVIDPSSMRQIFQVESGAHPIVRRLPLFLMYTGDSLQAPWFSRDILRNRRLLRDRSDMGTNTFFGDFSTNLEEPIGPVTQALALESGRGRVAVWSDSTLFSNFAIFLPGKMDLALGMVDWLNRENSAFPWRGLLAGAGVTLALLGFFAGRRPGEATSFLFSLAPLALCLGALLAIPTALASYERFYPVPQPDVPFDRIAFLETEIPGHLPLYEPMDEPTNHEYLASFVAAQRVGKRPFVTSSVAEAIQAPVVVVIHSHYRLTQEDILVLERYVREGGRLILLDSQGEGDLFQTMAQAAGIRKIAVPPPVTPAERSRNTLDILRAASPTLARSLILNSGPDVPNREPLPPLTVHSGKVVQRAQLRWVMTGGTPVLWSARPEGAAVTEAALGKGVVVFTTTTNLFAGSFVGAESEVPNDRQMQVLRWLFAWFRGETAVMEGGAVKSDNRGAEPHPSAQKQD